MSDNMRGALAMSIAMAAFSINDVMMKLLLVDLSLGQLLVLRGIASAGLAFALLSHVGGLGRLRDLWHPAVLARSAFECVAMLCFLSALMRISIATLTSTLQVMPLIATALAALVLKEPVGWRRWTATFVGFVGVLIIVAPIGEGAVFEPAALLGVAAALFAASRDITTRMAPASTPTLLLALAIILAGVLMGIGISAIEFAGGEGWGMVTWRHAAYLGVASVVLVAAHYLISRAMRIGQMSVVGPFRYVMVFWAMLWSWIIFAEPPTIRALVGVTIVVAAGLYTLQRERIRRVPVTSSPPVAAG